MSTGYTVKFVYNHDAMEDTRTVRVYEDGIVYLRAAFVAEYEDDAPPSFVLKYFDGKDNITVGSDGGVAEALTYFKKQNEVPRFSIVPKAQAPPLANLGNTGNSPLFVWSEPPKGWSFEENKEAVHNIITSILERETIDKQKEAYGPLLKKSFPVKTKASFEGRTGWASFYLPIQDIIDRKTYEDFKEMVTVDPANYSQDTNIFAPLQVSGAGKTKLCITLGMELGIVMIRLHMYRNQESVPIYPVLQKAQERIPLVQNKADYFLGAQRMVDLWVLAHIEFHKKFKAWYASTSFPQNRMHEFFIRIVEDGSGYQCVVHILAERTHLANKDEIAAFNTYYTDTTFYAKNNIGFLVLDDIVGVEAFMVGEFPHFRDEDPVVVGLHQMHEMKTKQPGGEYRRTTNLMYSLYTFADAGRKQGLKTILTGTHYSAFRALVLGSSTLIGPSRDRAACIHFPNDKFHWHIGCSAEDYAGFLRAHFTTLCFRENYHKKLEYLAHRPENFFVMFLEKLEVRMSMKKPTNRNDLLEVINDTLDKATSDVRHSAMERVGRFMNQRNLDSKDKAFNVRKLFYFVCMHNGCVDFIRDDDVDAVAFNLAFVKRVTKPGSAILYPSSLSPSSLPLSSLFSPLSSLLPLLSSLFSPPSSLLSLLSSLFSSLLSSLPSFSPLSSCFNNLCLTEKDCIKVVIAEQPIREAIREVVLKNETSTHPDHSSIFQVLAVTAELCPDEGQLAEHVAAHMFQRCSTSLFTFMKTQVPQSISDNSIINLLHFDMGTCGTYKEFGYSQTQALRPKRGEGVFPGTAAKPDLSLLLRNSQDDSSVPCNIQVKNYNVPMSVALLEVSLQSVNPAFFFTGFPVLKQEWHSWWASEASYFAKYVRIIVSFSGFESAVYSKVSTYNESCGMLQPILLVHPTKDLIGKLANNSHLHKTDPTDTPLPQPTDVSLWQISYKPALPRPELQSDVPAGPVAKKHKSHQTKLFSPKKPA